MKKLKKILNKKFFLIVIGIIIIVNINSHINKINLPEYKEWKNVSDDFKIVNEIALEYIENSNLNYCDISKLVNSPDLNNKQKLAIKNAKEYYDKYMCSARLDYIHKYNDGLSYNEELNGYTFLIYTKNKKDLKKNFKGFMIVELEKDWYYVHQHHI